MITVVNKHTHKPTPNDIYIGRGSVLGNPYSHMENTKATHVVATREEAIEKYYEWLKQKVESDDQLVINQLGRILRHLQAGNDVNLVCYCAPKACHGDVIKQLVEIWESRLKTINHDSPTRERH